MEENDIEIITTDNFPEIAIVLSRFLEKNQNVFVFPNLATNNRRVLLLTALFQHLQNNLAADIHHLCLAAVRVLSRDKTDLEFMICEKWINVLVERAGLYNLVRFENEEMQPSEVPSTEVVVEALKCLCNLAFLSEAARALCAHTCVTQGLVAFLKIHKDLPGKDEIMLYIMKLLFILTILRQDIKKDVNELHGFEYMTNCLNEILLEASVNSDDIEESHQCFLIDSKQAVVCEILKTQLNLVPRFESDDPRNAAEDAMYVKLMPILSSLLLAHATTLDKQNQVRSNVVNLLTCVPVAYYPELTPLLSENDATVKFQYEGRNMDALNVLVQFLQHCLTETTNTTNQYENLSPILSVMHKASCSGRAQRKYLRHVVLPPLRDVSQPPERGSELRNQLCRLLTTPVMQVRDLAAGFLFILCKEKVSRMVKYTGFGNAAGHLAQRGLLAGGTTGVYSSSSDDSDTEEYLASQSSLDPVTGCTRPPRVNPLEGMSEEQKEHEAMKLVNLLDRMMSSGIVRPARVGADGRPEPIDHILEIRESPPNRPQS